MRFAAAKKEDQEAMRDLSIQKAQNIKPRCITSEKHRKRKSQFVQKDIERGAHPAISIIEFHQIHLRRFEFHLVHETA